MEQRVANLVTITDGMDSLNERRETIPRRARSILTGRRRYMESRIDRRRPQLHSATGSGLVFPLSRELRRGGVRQAVLHPEYPRGSKSPEGMIDRGNFRDSDQPPRDRYVRYLGIFRIPTLGNMDSGSFLACDHARGSRGYV